MDLNQILDLVFGAIAIYTLVHEINFPVKTKIIKVGIVSDIIFLISMIMDFFLIMPNLAVILMIVSIAIGFYPYIKSNQG